MKKIDIKIKLIELIKMGDIKGLNILFSKKYWKDYLEHIITKNGDFGLYAQALTDIANYNQKQAFECYLQEITDKGINFYSKDYINYLRDDKDYNTIEKNYYSIFKFLLSIDKKIINNLIGKSELYYNIGNNILNIVPNTEEKIKLYNILSSDEFLSRKIPQLDCNNSLWSFIKNLEDEVFVSKILKSNKRDIWCWKAYKNKPIELNTWKDKFYCLRVVIRFIEMTDKDNSYRVIENILTNFNLQKYLSYIKDVDNITNYLIQYCIEPFCSILKKRYNIYSRI